MRHAALWDLDGTLINTSELTTFREKRQWKRCVQLATKAPAFQGVKEALAAIQALGCCNAVVTSSVSYYANALLEINGLAKYVSLVIAYHDYTRPKPSPDCAQIALSRLEVQASDAVGIGDALVDAECFRSAGIQALGAGWNLCFAAGKDWTFVLRHPSDVLGHIAGRQHEKP